jgi:putative transposase
MPHYRRNYVPGATYFFTVVTYGRARILTSEVSRQILRTAFLNQKKFRPFTIDAIVLLPDHLHAVWKLPPGDSDYSIRWNKIKYSFTDEYLANGGAEQRVTKAQNAREERGVWQRRFWEYTVRNEDDMKRCIDYVHWNPIKHGLVDRVIEYPWSSFHRYVALGEYEPGWGTAGCAEVEGAEWD